MDNDVYRKKSIDRLSSPEQLNDILKVARPRAWFIMTAVILLIIGAAVWAAFGLIEVTDRHGAVKQVHPIEFIIN
ncbi:MAG: hypothetical protein IKS17_01385 [Firmicutes bacterium]|nr:hypothetical protein [Bacillota bacterium]